MPTATSALPALQAALALALAPTPVTAAPQAKVYAAPDTPQAPVAEAQSDEPSQPAAPSGDAAEPDSVAGSGAAGAGPSGGNAPSPPPPPKPKPDPGAALGPAKGPPPPPEASSGSAPRTRPEAGPEAAPAPPRNTSRKDAGKRERGQLVLVRPDYIGDVSIDVREHLESRLLAGFGRAQLKPVDRTDTTCAESGCARAVAAKTGVLHVVTARIVAQSRDWSVRIEIINGGTGEVVLRDEASCEICGVGEVATQLEDRAAALGEQMRTELGAETEFDVKSDPPGARVEIDGDFVGLTPLRVLVTPGAHTVRLVLDGHVTVERDMDFNPGVRASGVFNLDALPSWSDPGMAPQTILARRAVGWTTLSVGVAALAASVGVLFLDGRPVQSRCSGDDADVDGDCRFVFDTAWGGAATATAGAAFATLGLTLLILTPKRARLRAQVQAQGIRLSGRF